LTNRTYLYIRKGEEALYRRFREIAKREGRSPSRILMDAIREYVRRHEPGNPQRLLTFYQAGREPGTGRILCQRCGNPAECRVWIQAGGGFTERILCSRCADRDVKTPGRTAGLREL